MNEPRRLSFESAPNAPRSRLIRGATGMRISPNPPYNRLGSVAFQLTLVGGGPAADEVADAGEQALVSRPAQLLHADAVIPDLRHVANAIPVELHHVDVVRFDSLSSRRNGAALTGVRAAKHAVGRHVVAVRIDGKGAQLIAAVGNGRKQPLHPLRVSFERLHVLQGSGLSAKRRIGMAILLADLPPLSCFARIEKARSRILDVTHRNSFETVDV